MNLEKMVFIPRAIGDSLKVLFNTDRPFTYNWQLCVALARLKWINWRHPKEKLMEIRLFGKTLHCFNHPATQFLCKEVFYETVYQPLVKLKSEMLILDIGANIGMSALYFHQEFNGAKIICVEPDAVNFDLLKRNSFAVSGDWNLINAAIGTKPGRISVKGQREKSSLNKTFLHSDAGNVEVDVITMMTLLEQRPDLVKMDIEGGEWAVMADLTERKLLNCARYWMIEFHEQEVFSEQFDRIKGTFAAEGFEKHNKGAVWHFYKPYIAEA